MPAPCRARCCSWARRPSGGWWPEHGDPSAGGDWEHPRTRSEATIGLRYECEDLGIIGRDRMQALLEQAQAGLIIHDFHGDEEHASSNKLFEYMAAGLPVIASDIHFAREVISRHHCGLLISPPTDPGAIAAAITWILEHPEEAERMGRAGCRAIEREYRWDQEANTLLDLYNDLDRRGRNA
ncbi:MAG: glycosyltransferase [Cyanobium sp.]